MSTKEAVIKIDIEEVHVNEKEILRNLMEKYDYEFSQYDNRDVNQLGLYGYDYFDCYWTEEGRYPFFIKVDGELAGFAMIGNYMEIFKDAKYSMSEFFIMYKYRKQGVGSNVAKRLFDRFPGMWELKRHPKNLASVIFWDRVIEEYTKGKYKKMLGCKEAEYDDGTYGDAFCFTTGEGAIL